MRWCAPIGPRHPNPATADGDEIGKLLEIGLKGHGLNAGVLRAGRRQGTDTMDGASRPACFRRVIALRSGAALGVLGSFAFVVPRSILTHVPVTRRAASPRDGDGVADPAEPTAGRERRDRARTGRWRRERLS
jgi:hypothetical protein